jgi:hypothetical protein
MKYAPLACALLLVQASTGFAQNQSSGPVCQTIAFANGQGGQVNLPGMPSRFVSATGTITIPATASAAAETQPVKMSSWPDSTRSDFFKKRMKGGFAQIQMFYPPQANSAISPSIGGNARNGNIWLLKVMNFSGKKPVLNGNVTICVQ